MSAEQSQESYDRVVAHQAKHGYCFFAAHHKEDDRFIGFIGLLNTSFEANFTPCVEIGWRLTPEYWGIGLAPEGAMACLDFAFSSLALEKVVSFTPTTNTPSQRVMQKIGMRQIDTFKHPLLKEGDPLELHVLYQITAAEFGAGRISG